MLVREESAVKQKNPKNKMQNYRSGLHEKQLKNLNDSIQNEE